MYFKVAQLQMHFFCKSNMVFFFFFILVFTSKNKSVVLICTQLHMCEAFEPIQYLILALGYSSDLLMFTNTV